MRVLSWVVGAKVVVNDQLHIVMDKLASYCHNGNPSGPESTGHSR